MDYQGHVENGMVVLDQRLPLPDGTPVRVEPIGAAPANFWEPSTLDELAARQRVPAPGTFDDLFGGWPDDELNDGFEADLLRCRKSELEQLK